MNSNLLSVCLVGSAMALATTAVVLLVATGLGLVVYQLGENLYLSVAVTGGLTFMGILLSYFIGGYGTASAARRQSALESWGTWGIISCVLAVVGLVVGMRVAQGAAAALAGAGAGASATVLTVNALNDIFSGKVRAISDIKYIDGKVVTFFTRAPGPKEKPSQIVDKTAKQTEALVDRQIERQTDQSKEALFSKVRLGTGLGALATAALMVLGALSCRLGSRKAHLAN